MSQLSQIIHERPLLLDFDGPVCSVFSGLPPIIVARSLIGLLRSHGIQTSTMEEEADPLEIFKWSCSLGDPSLARLVDDSLREAELEAIPSAEPTRHAHAIIAHVSRRRPVGIVSNNSGKAISAYLELHNMSGMVATIMGRQYGVADTMKPNPHLLLGAAEAIHKRPGECIFIGDSVSDIGAARAAGMPVIALANKARKRPAMTSARPDFLVTDMSEIWESIQVPTEPRN